MRGNVKVIDDTVDFSSDPVSEAEIEEPVMINNSDIFYVPFHLTCGVEVKARPGVLSNCSKVSGNIFSLKH